MKKNLHTLIGILLVSAFAKAQISFSDGSNLLEVDNLRGGVAMAITDVNNDNLDDIIRLDGTSALQIEYQQEDGSFVLELLGNADSAWGIVVADVDRNGIKDIIAGGAYDGLKLFIANDDGSDFTKTNLDGPNIFLQNANFTDIDNDGEIDFFGCHDDGISSPYHNDGNGNFTYDTNLIDAVSTIESDNSGNYGSIWTDYDNDGDVDLYISKCRQGVDDPDDGRRLNLLFRNDGDGSFTEVAPAAGLQPKTQTWASGFDDLDNDGDFDVVMVNHFTNHQIFENNGDGTFTDITASTGIVDELLDVGFGIQVMMEDLDNDTYIDILMTTTNGNHHVFMNNGDMTFTDAPNPFPTSGTIQSAAVGDVNNDGFIDVVAGFANGFNTPSNSNDELFLNNGNENNWSKIALTGVESNISGLGARIEITGDWGTQVREVRAGESYGTQNSLMAHFGLSTFSTIENITITWPSGTVDSIDNPEINQTLSYIEGDNALSLDDNTDLTFNLFPNPSQNIITVKGITESQSLRIFNILGKEIRRTRINPDSTIDISSLETGVYFVKIKNITKKLIKN